MLPDIDVYNFDISKCVVLKMPIECAEHDFMVCMELNGLCWRATCARDALQECIEMGIKRNAV